MKKIPVILFLLLISLVLQGQNTVSIASQSVVPGQVFDVQVTVNNADPFVALQLDLTLPSALSLVDSSFQINPARKNGQTVQYTILSGGVIRIVCYSANNAVFTGSSGWLVQFRLKAGTVPGNYALTPRNVTLGNAAGDNILTGTTPGTILIKAPNLQISRDSIDFGRTAVSQHTTRSFVLQNTGTEALNISKIIIPDSQFTANVQPPFSIAAGQSANVNLTFKPTWKGTFDFPVTVHSNDPDDSLQQVTITSKAYTINEIHVGSMAAFSGSQADLLISVNNMEPFSGVQFDLILPAPLQYVDGSATFTGRNTDQQVSAQMISKNTLRIIAFSTDNKSFTGTGGDLIKLSFKVNGTGGYYSIGIQKGLIAGLDGTNILSSEYGGSLRVNAPNISCETSLDFGQVSSLASKTLNLQVSNNGSDTLKIDHIVFTNSSFTSNTTFPIIIPVGQTQTIPVQFKDSVKGSYSATLNIFSNDPDQDPFKVQLSAETYIPNYLIIPDQQFLKNQPVWVEVWVKNYQPFVALQFNLNYPARVFKCQVDSAQLTSRMASDQLQVSVSQPGNAQVIVYSMNQTPATGQDGSIMKIKFIPIDTVGTFNFTLSNAILGNSSSQNILYGTRDGKISLLPSAPGAPTATAATAIDQVSFTANWTAPTSGTTPTGYYLDVATDSLFTDTVSGFGHLDVGLVLTKKVTGLSPQTKYYYRIEAYNTGGTSSSSNVINLTTLPSAPGAPTATAATAIDQVSFTANWTAPTSGFTPTGYYLDVATDSLFTDTVSGFGHLDVGLVLTKKVTGLSPQTKYYYRIEAYNTGGTSSSSNVINLTTLPSAPGAPTATAATAIDQVSFTANWTAPTSGFTPTGYYLDVATDSLFTDTVSGFGHLDVGLVLTKKITGLSPQTKYYYRVQAYNTGGTSSYSNVISLTTLSNVITFSVTRDSLSLPADSGSQVTFQISANVNWTITADSSWLSVTPSSGHDNETITVTTKSPNNTNHDRITKLFIVDTYGDSLIVVVVQDFATAVRDFGFSKNIKITPNPVANTVTISLKDMSRRITDLMLVNIFGKVVYKLHGKQLDTDALKIDVATLPEGIYLLGLEVGKDVVVRKIVVNHSFWH